MPRKYRGLVSIGESVFQTPEKEMKRPSATDIAEAKKKSNVEEAISSNGDKKVEPKDFPKITKKIKKRLRQLLTDALVFCEKDEFFCHGAGWFDTPIDITDCTSHKLPEEFVGWTIQGQLRHIQDGPGMVFRRIRFT